MLVGEIELGGHYISNPDIPALRELITVTGVNPGKDGKVVVAFVTESGGHRWQHERGFRQTCVRVGESGVEGKG